MSRAQPTILGDPKRPTDITRWNERLARVLNGNVNYGSTMSNADKDKNMNCWKVAGVTPATPNTDFTIQHSLRRIPLTLNGWDTDNLGVIGRSPTTPWTETTVTLRCSTASANYRVILI